MLCVKCGKEIDKYDFTGIYGFLIQPAFGSRFDGGEITIHCCSGCTDELIRNEFRMNRGCVDTDEAV